MPLLTGRRLRPVEISNWVAALVLGGIAFWLNGFRVSVGWGLDFVFGSMLVFAALRILSPGQVLLAGTIAASRSIFLWQHPWAWLVWTAEAAFLAAAGRRSSPVRRDVFFWILGGVPLLWFTYGVLLGMDGASLRVVILKQAINGVLNVAVAEFVFLAITTLRRKADPAPNAALPLDSLILSLFVAVATIPGIVFMGIDAGGRQHGIETLVRARLSESLEMANGMAVRLAGRSSAAPQALAPRLGERLAQAASPGVHVVLVSPAGSLVRLAGTDLPPGLERSLAAFAKREQVGALAQKQFGTSLMTTSRDTAFIASRELDGHPGWTLVATTWASSEILEQREAQANLLLALAVAMVGLTVLASVLAARATQQLHSIGRAVADMAALGQESAQIRAFVVDEVADIFSSIRMARSRVSREREALLVTKRRLQTISRYAPLVIYTLSNTPGRPRGLTFISDTIEAMLGYTAEEVSEPGWWLTAVHPDDREGALEASAHLDEATPVQQEYRVRHKQGHYVWVYDTLCIDAMESGEAVGVLIDISERKAAMDKLLQAGRMESLGRMAAGVAHELNQPLNFIKVATLNLTRRLARDQFDPEHAEQKLHLVLSQVERAAAIVGQVRTFGKAAAGATSDVRVDDVLAEVLSLLGWQLDNAGIAVDYRNQAGSVSVRGDSGRLSQVIINLLLNACDAIVARPDTGGQGGQVVVTLGRAAGAVTVTVEDNGIGIPPAELPLLFEPFFSTKSPQNGTGLGLSVSYGIISELGGEIRAENTGSGARFVITLPVAPAMAEPSAGVADQSEDAPVRV